MQDSRFGAQGLAVVALRLGNQTLGITALGFRDSGFIKSWGKVGFRFRALEKKGFGALKGYGYEILARPQAGFR